jgi:hypothetical protein
MMSASFRKLRRSGAGGFGLSSSDIKIFIDPAFPFAKAAIRLKQTLKKLREPERKLPLKRHKVWPTQCDQAKTRSSRGEATHPSPCSATTVSIWSAVAEPTLYTHRLYF